MYGLNGSFLEDRPVYHSDSKVPERSPELELVIRAWVPGCLRLEFRGIHPMIESIVRSGWVRPWKSRMAP